MWSVKDPDSGSLKGQVYTVRRMGSTSWPNFSVFSNIMCAVRGHGLSCRRMMCLHQALVINCTSQFLEHLNVVNCIYSFLSGQSLASWKILCHNFSTFFEGMVLAFFFIGDAAWCHPMLSHFGLRSKWWNQCSSPVMKFSRQSLSLAACHWINWWHTMHAHFCSCVQSGEPLGFPKACMHTIVSIVKLRCSFPNHCPSGPCDECINFLLIAFHGSSSWLLWGRLVMSHLPSLMKCFTQQCTPPALVLESP